MRPIILLLTAMRLVGTQAMAQVPPRLTAAEAVRWRADLRYLAAELPRRHPNLYHAVSREAFARAVRRLDARIPTLRRHEVILELARLVALVGDGHTNVAPARDTVIGFHSLPLRFYLFSDGLFVRAADTAHAGLRGVGWYRLRFEVTPPVPAQQRSCQRHGGGAGQFDTEDPVLASHHAQHADARA